MCGKLNWGPKYNIQIYSINFSPSKNMQIRCFWPSFLPIFFHFSTILAVSHRRTDLSLQTTTFPGTRLRGQVGCYSCVSWTDWHGDFRQTDAPQTNLFNNKTELANIFTNAGMRMPKWTGRCAETNPTARPNFAGAEMHICENTEEKPGACIKLKGQYKGRWYVYRECWDRMWAEPRGYHHEYSGKCYADQPVQQFVATQRNILCFCEEDLCNGQIEAIRFYFNSFVGIFCFISLSILMNFYFL